MASQGAESLLELRRQLQERKALLLRQLDEERGRVARLASNCIFVKYPGVLCRSLTNAVLINKL